MKVVSFGKDRTICVYNISNSKIEKILKYNDKSLASMALSENGNYLVACTFENELVIWDTSKDFELLGSCPTSEVIQRVTFVY